MGVALMKTLTKMSWRAQSLGGMHTGYVFPPHLSKCNTICIICRHAISRMHARMQEEAYQSELANFADHGDEGEVWCAVLKEHDFSGKCKYAGASPA